MVLHNPYDCVSDELYQRLVGAEHSACATGTSCLTVAAVDGFISIQDSKLEESQRLARTQVYTPGELAAFVRAAKAGRYDDLIRTAMMGGCDSG
jgi:hypothetical protein